MDIIISETSALNVQLMGFENDFFLLDDPSRLSEGLFPDFNLGLETSTDRFPAL